MRKRSALMLVFVAISFSSIAAADDWPRFRGPNGDGQSDVAGIPVECQPDQSRWKTPPPGRAHSSPIVWGDRLFVTSGAPDTGEQIILAFNALSGEQLWEKRFPSGTHHQHADNSYATSTPAID